MIDAVLGCGACSGRDGTDKFARFGLTPTLSRRVKPPVIAECPINLECRVVGFHTVGDHDLFVGEVLMEHVAEHVLDTEGKPDAAKLDPLVLLRGGFWRIGDRVRDWH
jgi:flavin reductase (DIM6/NTAB) family NADH-FMN oxidoreductase RutF